MESTDPRGYALLRENFALICGSNLEPSSLARELFAKGLIATAAKEEAENMTGSKQKLDKILTSVMANGAPGVFEQFVEIVKGDKAHRWVADALEQDRGKPSVCGYVYNVLGFFLLFSSF